MNLVLTLLRTPKYGMSRFGLVGRGNAACAAEHRSSGCPDKDLAKDNGFR